MTPSMDEALRHLDPATPLTAVQRRRADDLLDRVLASAYEGPPEPRRSPRRRAVLVPAAALAATAAVVAVDGLTGAGEHAYASWVPVPSAVAPADLPKAEAACRDQLDGGSLDVARATTVLAERRGEHVALLVRTDDPDLSGACLLRLPHGGDATDVTTATGGSSGPALTAPAGRITQGAVAQLDGASFTDGAVGNGVVGVRIRSGSIEAEASVSRGRYVAWWPGPAFSRAAGGEPALDIRYDLTLADGAVVRDAEPARPS